MDTTKIARFKEFIAEVEKEKAKVEKTVGEMSMDILQDFFKEELNIIADIEEIIKDYEDDGVKFSYATYMTDPEYEALQDIGYDEGKIGLIKGILSRFSKYAIANIVEYWQKNGHGLKIFIMISNSKRNPGPYALSASDEIIKRLHAAFPQITVNKTNPPSAYDIVISF